MNGRLWREQELDDLREMWGSKSVGYIAKHLGRSNLAVKQKARRMHLGPHLLASDKISLHLLIQSLMGKSNYRFYKKKWLDMGIPVRSLRCDKNCTLAVKIEDFWKWASKHRNELNFAGFEEDSLGVEPAWAKEKRRIDQAAMKKHRKWTTQEDSMLRALLDQQNLDYSKVACTLMRSEAAVKRRAYDMGIAARPVRRDCKRWKPEELQTLVRMRADGYTFDQIAPYVNHTALAACGKYERMTEDERNARI